MEQNIKIFFLLMMVHFSNSYLFYEISKYNVNCFLEQVSADHNLFIKYKIFAEKENGTKVDLKAIENFVFTVQFQIIRGRNPIMTRYLHNLDGQIVFAPKKPDYYKVCVHLQENPRKFNDTMFMSIALTEDNDTAVLEDVGKIIKEEDSEEMIRTTFKRMNKLTENIIEKQKNEMEIEQISAGDSIKLIKWYKALCFLQVIVIIGIGLYHLRTFISFLKGVNARQ
ncbi:MAG: emp24/gp25L/p24 family protein [archaeon]|nr:emp24/gp25L/p24 family protein [archaeon]